MSVSSRSRADSTPHASAQSPPPSVWFLSLSLPRSGVVFLLLSTLYSSRSGHQPNYLISLPASRLARSSSFFTVQSNFSTAQICYHSTLKSHIGSCYSSREVHTLARPVTPNVIGARPPLQPTSLQAPSHLSPRALHSSPSELPARLPASRSGLDVTSRSTLVGHPSPHSLGYLGP